MYVDILEFWAGQMIRPDHRMGGWRWGCYCSSLTSFPRPLYSLWEVFATYFFTLRCSKPKILGKNYIIGKKLPECSQEFFTEVTKGCLGLEFLSAEYFNQNIWCLVEEKCSARGQGAATCPSQMCAGTLRAGKEGQAHPQFPPAHPPHSWQPLHRDFPAQRADLCFCVLQLSLDFSGMSWAEFPVVFLAPPMVKDPPVRLCAL